MRCSIGQLKNGEKYAQAFQRAKRDQRKTQVVMVDAAGTASFIALEDLNKSHGNEWFVTFLDGKVVASSNINEFAP